MANRWMAVCGACALAACGGGGSGGGGGNGSTSGTVGSNSLGSVAEAVSIQQTGPFCVNGSPNGTQTSELIVFLSSTGGHCTAAESGVAGPAATNVIIAIFASGSSTPPAIGAGTYTIGGNANLGVLAEIVQVDANGCSNNTGTLASAGSVTITSASSSGVSGTFTFSSFVDHTGAAVSGSLSGSFTTSNCGPPITNTTCSSGGGTTC
jgi:hypothetical protein